MIGESVSELWLYPYSLLNILNGQPVGATRKFTIDSKNSSWQSLWFTESNQFFGIFKEITLAPLCRGLKCLDSPSFPMVPSSPYLQAGSWEVQSHTDLEIATC